MDSPRKVVVRGREYRVHESGRADADGASTVLLHGIGMTHRSFARVQEAMPAGHRVLNLDLAGFGRSPAPRRGLSVEQYAADLAEVLARVDAWPAVVAGHSMGTQFAVELARIRPAEALGVALIGPVVDPARRTLPQQAADLARDTVGEPPSVNALVLGDYVRAGVRWYLKELGAMMDYPMLQRIRESSAEVAVIRGERDPIARERWCRRLVAASGGLAELVTIPGEHHVVPRTAPTVVARELVRLAERVDGRLPDVAPTPRAAAG
ncbi:pimeloyl-ACP methyl ester carboxylesterase [Agromyces ramosus]|uniref:Pimeloyl-ACP methyl ester carboxylesterase n=1 Tax=Agromyces ramosus TaxID=33879 RepID=A0A4Q7MPG4_9MICO|nr:alpha/beta hydrolase [Agromyces ramosus]RZS68599.1 pimeloyl-ACP methyl ester carboxylesterase [Agromyces ramosus]